MEYFANHILFSHKLCSSWGIIKYAGTTCQVIFLSWWYSSENWSVIVKCVVSYQFTMMYCSIVLTISICGAFQILRCSASDWRKQHATITSVGIVMTDGRWRPQRGRGAWGHGPIFCGQFFCTLRLWQCMKRIESFWRLAPPLAPGCGRQCWWGC